ncbi:MAG: DinB family protein [Propionibacteriaceae bacterium]
MITTGTERELIEGWLDEHRRALVWKCEGLTDEQLKLASDPPSTLTLLGLVRHMAGNERWWFSQWAARLQVDDLYASDEPGRDPDGDFTGVPDAEPAADLATFAAEVAASKIATAELDLDAVITSPRGRPMSVRWIFLHMIEEYARHNGHADLLREHLDGTTGDFPDRD